MFRNENVAKTGYTHANLKFEIKFRVKLGGLKCQQRKNLNYDVPKIENLGKYSEKYADLLIWVTKKYSLDFTKALRIKKNNSESKS